jgi:hypothetical protein
MKHTIKLLLIPVVLTLTTSAHAYFNRPYGNVIILPQNTNNQAQKPLQGTGMVFNSTVKVATKTSVDPTTGKPVETKTFTTWIRNCGDVTLPTTKDDEKKLKEGDRVELKFDKDGSCVVASWRRFY